MSQAGWGNTTNTVVAAAIATLPALINGDLHPLTCTGPSFQLSFTLAAICLYAFAIILIQSHLAMHSHLIQSWLLIFAITVPTQLAQLAHSHLSLSYSICATGCALAPISIQSCQLIFAIVSSAQLHDWHVPAHHCHPLFVLLVAGLCTVSVFKPHDLLTFIFYIVIQYNEMVSLHCIRVPYFVFCGPHVVGRVKEDTQLKWSAIFDHITMWHQKQKQKRWSKNFKTQTKYLTCAAKLTHETPITMGMGVQCSTVWQNWLPYLYLHYPFGNTLGLPTPM